MRSLVYNQIEACAEILKYPEKDFVPKKIAKAVLIKRDNGMTASDKEFFKTASHDD